MRRVLSSGGRRSTAYDDGASAVEFALVLPFLLMLVFGMLTGGITLNQKLGVEQANREAARWASTLPLDSASDEAGSPCPAPSGEPATPDDCWFANVARNAVFSAHGALADDLDGRFICVAYIHERTWDHDFNPATPDRTDVHSKSLTWNDVTATITGGNETSTGTQCFDDGLGAASKHVQVQVIRPGWLNVIFLSRTFEMEARSVAVFEPTPGYEKT